MPLELKVDGEVSPGQNMEAVRSADADVMLILLIRSASDVQT